MVSNDELECDKGDELDDWRELMPDTGGRTAPVTEWMEMAMFRDPEEITVWEAMTAAFGLMLLPAAFVGGLAVATFGYLVLTGEVTIAELVATWNSAPRETQTSGELLSSLGDSLFTFAIQFPIFLGLLIWVKVMLKVRTRWSR